MMHLYHAVACVQYRYQESSGYPDLRVPRDKPKQALLNPFSTPKTNILLYSKSKCFVPMSGVRC